MNLPDSHNDDPEGVLKFDLEFIRTSLPKHPTFNTLESWRQILYRLGLIGRSANRYAGLAFGNVSLRTTGEQFLISGTQTGGNAKLNIDDYASVTDFRIERNSVRAEGLTEPSSESLTHGALYAIDTAIACVFHVHSPEIWQAAMTDLLPLPKTSPDQLYGTPALAWAIQRAAREQPGRPICMGGHEDGIMAYGSSPSSVGQTLVATLAEALQAKLADRPYAD